MERNGCSACLTPSAAAITHSTWLCRVSVMEHHPWGWGWREPCVPPPSLPKRAKKRDKIVKIWLEKSITYVYDNHINQVIKTLFCTLPFMNNIKMCLMTEIHSNRRGSGGNSIQFIYVSNKTLQINYKHLQQFRNTFWKQRVPLKSNACTTLDPSNDT